MDSCAAHFFDFSGEMEASGEDATSFLQGQCSQDLRGEKGIARYGLWLSLKGRILADSYLLRQRENAWTILSVACPLARVRDELDSRIIMDELGLEVVNAPRRGLLAFGEAASAVCETMQLSLPELGRFMSRDGTICFWGRNFEDEPSLFFRFGSEEAAAACRGGVEKQGIRLLDETEVAIKRLKVGLYLPPTDVFGNDLPQETGLDHAGVSYTKGCYIGQEVMARIKSLGRPRRVLHTVQVSQGPLGAPPWKLVGPSGKPMGELRSYFPTSTDDGGFGCAMLKIGTEVSELEVEGDPSVSVWQN